MTGPQSSASALAYYDANAEDYVTRTWGMDMAEVRARFLAHLAPGSRLLDAGCGSGRDVLAFKASGYAVDAFDGSSALAALASVRTGQAVDHLRFDQLQSQEAYDGVWACSSLVHLTDAELATALEHLFAAARHGGVFYTCLKEGRGMRVDAAGRPFNDFTKERLRTAVRKAGFVMKELWRTPQRGPEGGWWLNVIAFKP